MICHLLIPAEFEYNRRIAFPFESCDTSIGIHSKNLNLTAFDQVAGRMPLTGGVS